MAATALEAYAGRICGLSVDRVGIALRREAEAEGHPCIAIGLAGGLVPELEPGSVLVPAVVGLPDGRQLQCDPFWVERLAGAASDLGFEPQLGPMLTAPALVTGPQRELWARHGYIGVDMETGTLAARGMPVATVRVVLDTPVRSIGAEWERPVQALLRPRLWRELAWLAIAAPRFAARAAGIAGWALARSG